MNILNNAINAHKKNDFELAKKLYFTHLLNNKGDANAHQLLGTLLLQQEDIETAINHLQRSLQLNVKQAHVWCNLAICLFKINNNKQAIDCYLKSIALDKKYVLAYAGLIKILIIEKQISRANQVLNSIPTPINAHHEIVNEKIKLFRIQNRNKELIKLYFNIENKQALTKNQIFDLALLLRIEGKSQQALPYFLVLKQAGMNNYQLNHNLANVYSDLGDLSQAIEYYYKAIDLNPVYIESHENLNELLWELDRFDEFLVSYAESILKYPNDTELNFKYILSLIQIDNLKLAKNMLLKLDDERKNNAQYHYLFSLCLEKENKQEEALVYQAKTLSFVDVKEEYVLKYVSNLIATKQYNEAKNILLSFLKTNENNMLAIAYLTTCYRYKNNYKADEINQYDKLVKEYTLAFEGISITKFCDQLNQYLNKYHTAKRQPLNQTLVNGTQTRGSLFNDEDDIIKDLVNCISLYINDYISEIPSSENSYALRQGANFNFAGSWSVRLNSQGFHGNHVHPMGWLSAVFYVDLPRCIQNGNNKQGWLKFGEPDQSLNTGFSPEYYIKPSVGKLVVFPSYMWHGTVPFQDTQRRTTIAFDIEKID